MTKLKPCPLCGGEGVYATTWYVGEPWYVKYGFDARGTTIICEKCGCTIPSRMEADDADEAWNMRAERTCNIVTKDNLAETDGNGDVWHECTSCHCQWSYGDLPEHGLNYCPNCGAKVVER